ncbi:hypothetical protein GCM10027416_04720 [Okibacterium endophyticum]
MKSSASFASAPLLIVCLLALIALLTPYPGSLSVVLYELIGPTMWHLPGVAAAAPGGILTLAVLFAGVLIQAWRTDRARFARGVAAAAGIPLAYLVSEGLKLVFVQERPCRIVAELPDCPPVGDWSLPSNHSTVAFALFCAIAVTRHGWLPWLAAGLAVFVAWGRIAEGVHYPHDVALGSLLGIGTVGLAAVGLARPVTNALGRAQARRRTS